MRDREILGPVELLVLLAVMRLDEDAYGVPIAQAIREATRKDVLLGSIYVTLDRLERKGLVTSRLGEPTAERGGRAKRYFRVTARGVKEAKDAQRALTALTRGIPHFKGGLA